MKASESGKYFGGFLSALNSAASLWIMLMMVWIIADIVGRAFFNHPIAGTPEFASNSLAAITFLQIPYILRKDGHLRASAIFDRLGPRKREVVNILASLMGVGLFILAVASIAEPTYTAWAIREYEGEGSIRVPIYPVKTIILLGSVLMAVQFFMNLLRSIRLLRHPVEDEDLS